MTPFRSLPAAIVAFTAVAFSPLARPQTYYIAEKTQSSAQIGPSSVVLDPNAAAGFFFEAPTDVTLAPPGLAALTIPLVASAGVYEISRTYPNLASLNAAFPDGGYTLYSKSTGSVDLSLTKGLYPVVPQINGGSGTWLPGGILALDPTVSNTLDINTFSGYATAGAAGFMSVGLYNLSGSSASDLQEQFATESLLAGEEVLAAPVTSFTIPAKQMTAGGLYEFVATYATFTDVDKTSVAPYNVFGLYATSTTVYIIAQTGTTPTAAAPSITTQMSNQTAAIGSTATFNLPGNFPTGGAAGASWYFIDTNGNSGVPAKDTVNNTTTNAQLVIPNVAASDAGSYYVFALSPGGIVESQAATLTVTPAVSQAPSFSTQPDSQALNTGSTAVFTIVASDSSAYQWVFSTDGGSSWSNLTDGNGISGSTGPQLVIQGGSAADNGEYACVATNSIGSTQSNAAVLTVATSPSPGYLINISARAFVGSGGNILIGGFYIVGSTSRSVLIQALGPALAGEGVSGVLQHPALSIHDSTGATIYSDTGWGSSQVLLNAAAAAYANPVLQKNSADSEVLLTLPPGGYTAEISGADGGTGVALCAIYQLP
jgi:hypothetical protein